jgi:NAD-dependent deacetylase
MKRFVCLSGAGISAESGLSTFRGPGGLWEGRRPEEVATPGAFADDPGSVLRFYNERRAQVRMAQPNAAHRALAELEKHFDVFIITQNVDDLHERAGSTNVWHLHGQIRRARSTADPDLILDLGDRDIQLGDLCPLGSQLRPDVVWFGEAVPAMSRAIDICAEADLFLVVGTSLNVYPAASLIEFIPDNTRCFLIDPNLPNIYLSSNFETHCTTACEGVPRLLNLLTQ